MLDLQPFDRFLFKRFDMEESMRADGAAEETAEDRLEAALERIARAVEAGDPRVDAVAARLDHIIETLRAALGK